MNATPPTEPRLSEIHRSSPSGGTPFPRGLVLFPPGTDPRRRRRRLLFAAVYLMVVAALVWPVYPRVAGLLPPLFGLPGAFVWPILVLAVAFAALLWLYLTDAEG